MDEQDVRILILKWLVKHNVGLSDVDSNKFLSTLPGDVGVIRRSIVDLIDLGLVLYRYDEKELSRKHILNLLSTSKYAEGSTKEQKYEWKSTKRFFEQVGVAPKIEPINLKCTLSGVDWLLKYDTTRRTNTLVKYDILIKSIVLIIGFLLGIIAIPIKGCIEGVGEARPHNTQLENLDDIEPRNQVSDTIYKTFEPTQLEKNPVGVSGVSGQATKVAK